MDRVAFIINPFSAKKNYKKFISVLKSELKDPLYLISKSLKDTENFIENNLSGIDIFVAVGGDGTISTVANLLNNTDKILGIYPAGSGNGFARENNFGSDIKVLLAKLTSGQFKEIDTFTINGRFSVNVSGTGFDGKVAELFEHTSRGLANYIKVSLKTYFKYKPKNIKFEKKYAEFNGIYLMINIANTRQFGNNAFIAPQASKSDGFAEIALVKKFPLYYAPVFAFKLFTKNIMSSRYISYISTPEIRFEIDAESWHLDGESVKIQSPVHVKILHKSLRILV